MISARGGTGQGGPGGRGGLGQIDYEGRDARAITLEHASVPRVANLFRPYWRAVLAIVGVVIVAALVGTVPPLLIRAIIDDALPHADASRLTVLVIAMIVIGVLAGLIQVLEQWLNLRVGQAVMFDLRNALYQRIQGMPFRFFTTARTGEIMSRLLNDVNGVQDVVTRSLVNAGENVVTVVATVGVMLAINSQLALVSLVLLPFFIVPVRRAGRIRAGLARETQRKIADVSSRMQEALGVNGIFLMKVFGRQSYEYGRFHSTNRELMHLQIRQGLVGRWFQMLVGLFGSVSPALILWFGGWEVINGTLTLGSMVAFTAYLARIYTPVSQLVNVQIDILASLGLFERIFEYLDLEPEVVEKPGAIRPALATGHLVFEDVGFSYDGSRAALEDVSFEVQPGQMVALVGPSGAGKTTVSYLIPRLYDPLHGRVLLDGHDLRDVSLVWLAEQLAVVPQETFLFHTSIAENLRYADPDASQAQLVAAAQAANIHDMIVGLPEAYETVVGERGFRLSGGERQRIAIARALLKDPRLIILDEATSALDSRSERLVQEALAKLLLGRTSIVIAHRLSTVLAADQILVLEHGHLVQRGTHGELLAQGGLYAQLYREQFERYPTGTPATPRDTETDRGVAAAETAGSGLGSGQGGGHRRRQFDS